MLAVAQWLFEHGAPRLEVHADGMHARHFDIAGWLEANAFKKTAERRPDARSWCVRTPRGNARDRFPVGTRDLVPDVRGARVLVEAKGVGEQRHCFKIFHRNISLIHVFR